MSDPSGNRPALRLLATGFGPFPGVARNPSADVVRALSRAQADFSRRGLSLTTAILPVTYDFAPMLDALSKRFAPDAIVHIGVAGRRRCVSVETQARNRRSIVHADASGRAPNSRRLGPRESFSIANSWKPRAMAVALRRSGVPAAVSRDAGAYVCNALLYHSLARPGTPAIFIHIPGARVCAPADIARALTRILPDFARRLARTRKAVR